MNPRAGAAGRSARRKIAAVILVAAGGCASLAGCTSPSATTATVQDLGLVPLPASVEVSDAAPFVLDDETRVVVDAAAGSAVGQEGAVHVGELLAAELRTPTALDLPVETGPEADGGAMVLRLEPGGESWDAHGLLDDPAAEAYTLEAGADGVVLASATPAGLYRGTRTLLQLLPPEVETPRHVDDVAWEVPAVTITDEPRYAYRGAMLDVARRFATVEDVQRFVDHLADYRLNVLHLHLSDDQGWRLTVDGLPELTEVGGRTQEGWPPGTGGPWFYTPEEYAQIVEYAADRYVTVVPEIDGPGHTLAAQSVLGSLRCDGTPGEPYWGPEVNNPMICSSDENMPAVQEYLDTVLAAVVAQNPGPYVHLGGDEAPSPAEGWYVDPRPGAEGRRRGTRRRGRGAPVVGPLVPGQPHPPADEHRRVRRRRRLPGLHDLPPPARARRGGLDRPGRPRRRGLRGAGRAASGTLGRRRHRVEPRARRALGRLRRTAGVRGLRLPDAGPSRPVRHDRSLMAGRQGQ